MDLLVKVHGFHHMFSIPRWFGVELHNKWAKTLIALGKHVHVLIPWIWKCTINWRKYNCLVNPKPIGSRLKESLTAWMVWGWITTISGNSNILLEYHTISGELPLSVVNCHANYNYFWSGGWIAIFPLNYVWITLILNLGWKPLTTVCGELPM